MVLMISFGRAGKVEAYGLKCSAGRCV